MLDGCTTRGGNYCTLFTPESWKVLHAVLQGKGLERVGLLESKSIANFEEKTLIFKCLLATTDESGQKKAARKPPIEAALTESNNHVGNSHKPAHSKTAKAAPPPSIRDISMKTSSSSEISQAKTHEEEDEIRNLIYPKSTTPRQQKSMLQILSGISDAVAQDLLDELHGRIEAKKNSPTPVGEAVSYLRGLVNDHKAGTFIPSMAITVQAQREQQKEIERQIAESKKSVLQEKTAAPTPARSTKRRSVKELYEKATGKNHG